jgi:hypothetical protein
MTDQIRAPWTPEQVAALNRFQAEGGMHPFTCGGEHAPGSPALVAYTDGWRCPQPYGEACDYRQDWAHAFMADPGAWPKPFADLRKAATEATEPATITDPEWLRQQYAAAIQPLLMDTLPKPIAAARARDIADTVLFVRDRHLAQLRQRIQLADADLADTAAAVARLQRLRAQLAAEHAKAVRADQQPRPDLDHLRVSPHNGIAAGLETAIFFVEHHLREVGEEARITPDNPATSSDTADNPLREGIATAEHRLRLAHEARRAKEHQLDGIRRALCDVGAMRDDDPYSHADLEDVIRQVFTPPLPVASGEWLRTGTRDLSIPGQPQEQQ